MIVFMRLFEVVALLHNRCTFQNLKLVSFLLKSTTEFFLCGSWFVKYVSLVHCTKHV